MLREIDSVRQIENEPARRWFTSSFFDLIVWLGDSGDPSGFQLCYDKGFAKRGAHYGHLGGYAYEIVATGIDYLPPAGPWHETCCRGWLLPKSDTLHFFLSV
jgi:hypothetical protein